MTPGLDTVLAELNACRTLLFNAVCEAGPEDYRRHYHPDLSPMGWHLGHCVFTEIFWIRERVLGQSAGADGQRALYVPELSYKGARGDALPPFRDLCVWAGTELARNGGLLEQMAARPLPGEPLLDHGFLFRFLAEHWAQHCETLLYILAQRRLSETEPETAAPPAGQRRDPDLAFVPAGEHRIGADNGCGPYDNERPRFVTALPAFHIARHPVRNGEFAAFMAEDGYDRPELWSRAGWDWRTRHAASHPEHWRSCNGTWRAVDALGMPALAAGDVLHGVNLFEAQAFATWAGARLPHEYEWEAACRSGVLEGVGDAWEWCSNAFHPYAGFTAWPYEGYSVPWFDGRHFTLRGASRYTRPLVRRPSFRNYYQADKRHVRAGLRLVYA